jgi:hypothetical protein
MWDISKVDISNTPTSQDKMKKRKLWLSKQKELQMPQSLELWGV